MPRDKSYFSYFSAIPTRLNYFPHSLTHSLCNVVYSASIRCVSTWFRLFFILLSFFLETILSGGVKMKERKRERERVYITLMSHKAKVATVSIMRN
jgi:hypothetical protein